ncbi:MAG: O-antigen ligase family protein [Bacteroidetes bacterium]|nr:O-antigen ligase family protein [Bacteroidota bacterium]MBS1630253.1 O-antigen ligase family protein [Bacteroidota bacterium]
MKARKSIDQQKASWSHITAQIQLICCCLIAASFPLWFNYTAICIWLLALAWLLHADFKGSWQRLRHNRGYAPFLLYFLLYALSYTYSSDKAQAGFDLTQKLSFILLPLILGAGTHITRRGWERILLSLSLSLTLVGIFCMARAYHLWQMQGDDEVFFYHRLVAGLDANAVYMAWYVLFSLAALSFYRWTSCFLRWQGLLLKWLLFAIQLLFFILLSSRTMLMILCFIALPCFLHVRVKKFRWTVLHIIAALILAGGLGAFLIKTDNPVRQRFEDVRPNNLRHAFQPHYADSNQQFSNLTMRLFIWRVGFENIQANHLWWAGAGNGDVHNLQNDRIASYGFRMTNESGGPSAMRDIDLHNMYLQTVLAVGIPGLLVLLVLLFSPFFYLTRTGYSHLAFLFHISACLFMLQEAVFQTQSGIIYYIFFSVLFWQFSQAKMEKPAAR